MNQVKEIMISSVLLFALFLLISCSKTPQDIQDDSGEVLQEKETASIDKGEETADSGESSFYIPKASEVENQFTVLDAFPNLSFTEPLDFQNTGDGSGRIFLVERRGYIYVLDGATGTDKELFLDISKRVDSSGQEMGLLGLAFHPGFEENGLFFVNYTTSNNTVISGFKTDANGGIRVDAAGEEIVLTFQQPYSNHNGGQIVFGPDDGYLYIATGDGGGAGDPRGNSQNLETLLGKILRINVEMKEDQLNYNIPQDNPFAGNQKGYREEIYAYGLRNPWRFSFDSSSGRLWAADVGQDRIEEIDLIESGKNYGWNIMEGSQCYNPPEDCDTTGLGLPLYEYQHSEGRSITGGFVYKGNSIPVLKGAYIYSDFVSGYIWGLWYDGKSGPQKFLLSESGLNISSFGLDEDGELYITAFDGKIYRLVKR